LEENGDVVKHAYLTAVLLIAAIPQSACAVPAEGTPAAVTVLCDRPLEFAAAASQNTLSLTHSAWTVSGHAETGWEVYVPLIGHEIGAPCAATTPAFAARLAIWQGAHGRPAAGVMDAASLNAMGQVWASRRPFAVQRAAGICPPPPQVVAQTRADETFEDTPLLLRADALEAYRRLRAAARVEVPEVAADPKMLTLTNGYDNPAEKPASCSAHRTGYAMDFYLGSAPGYPAESAADPNRLFQSRSAAYRWLVANAYRFGFVTNPVEPRHWEWTGAQ
jgi:D-alanyl-D-alanine carboxypeptidase